MSADDDDAVRRVGSRFGSIALRYFKPQDLEAGLDLAAAFVLEKGDALNTMPQSEVEDQFDRYLRGVTSEKPEWGKPKPPPSGAALIAEHEAMVTARPFLAPAIAASLSVAVSTTPAPLPACVAHVGVWIQGDATNDPVHPVRVGDEHVSTSRGFELRRGARLFLRVVNPSILYAVATGGAPQSLNVVVL